LSFASSPLFRTAHLNSNYRVSEAGNGEIIVKSSWSTSAYRLGKTLRSFGLQEHRLRKTDEGLKICYRKIMLHNDIVDNVLDFYCI
jgi:3-phenylpropionate/cinnamic acid dioxygenase small subunit